MMLGGRFYAFLPGQRALFVLLALTSPGTLAAEEPDNQASFQPVEALPGIIEHRLKPSTLAYDKLLRSHGDSRKFREDASRRIFPIRAMTPPPPPFDPQTPRVEHGVAIELNHMLGYRWATSAILVEGAQKVEIKAQDGNWYPVKIKRRCEAANLVTLEGLPKTIPTGAEYSKQRAFEIRDPKVLTEELPVLAITNLEGAHPTLHLGALAKAVTADIGQDWEHNLKISPGTPLLDPEGRVVLIQISPILRHIATSPLDGFRCAPESSSDESNE